MAFSVRIRMSSVRHGLPEKKAGIAQGKLNQAALLETMAS